MGDGTKGRRQRTLLVVAGSAASRHRRNLIARLIFSSPRSLGHSPYLPQEQVYLCYTIDFANYMKVS